MHVYLGEDGRCIASPEPLTEGVDDMLHVQSETSIRDLCLVLDSELMLKIVSVFWHLHKQETKVVH